MRVCLSLLRCEIVLKEDFLGCRLPIIIVIKGMLVLLSSFPFPPPYLRNFFRPLSQRNLSPCQNLSLCSTLTGDSRTSWFYSPSQRSYSPDEANSTTILNCLYAEANTLPIIEHESLSTTSADDAFLQISLIKSEQSSVISKPFFFYCTHI